MNWLLLVLLGFPGMSKVKPLIIQTTSIPAAKLGVSYRFTLQALGGKTPYVWAITAGTLPQGLNLSTSGLISGIPKKAGTFNFTVKCTDSGGRNAEANFSLAAGTSGTIVSSISSAAKPDSRADYHHWAFGNTGLDCFCESWGDGLQRLPGNCGWWGEPNPTELCPN